MNVCVNVGECGVLAAAGRGYCNPWSWSYLQLWAPQLRFWEVKMRSWRAWDAVNWCLSTRTGAKAWSQILSWAQESLEGERRGIRGSRDTWDTRRTGSAGPTDQDSQIFEEIRESVGVWPKTSACMLWLIGWCSCRNSKGRGVPDSFAYLGNPNVTGLTVACYAVFGWYPWERGGGRVDLRERAGGQGLGSGKLLSGCNIWEKNKNKVNECR